MPSLGKQRKPGVLILGLGSALLALIPLSLVSGAVPLSADQLWQWLLALPRLLLPDGGTLPGGQQLDPGLLATHAIVFDIRLPRVVGAVVAGACLAHAGALMQGLFRNPLAGPEILGVSAGASLGAVAAVVSGAAVTSFLVLPLSAALGAGLIAFLIYLLSGSARSTGNLGLILTGLAVSGFVSAIVSSVLLFSRQYELQLYIFWTMGGLEGRVWPQVLAVLPFLVPALVAGFALSRRLDVLSVGEESAHTLGLPLVSTKRLIMTVATVLTAMSIAVAGPVAFIGMITPHLIRMLIGHRHRLLLPASTLAGALFLLLADLAGRTIAAPHEIKAGIITALLGSPYFLYLVLRHRRRLEV